MITYTIVITENAMIAHDGIIPRSKLLFYAVNLRIYTIGSVPVRKMDALNHMALELCIAHHIPCRQLYRYIPKKEEMK